MPRVHPGILFLCLYVCDSVGGSGVFFPCERYISSRTIFCSKKEKPCRTLLIRSLVYMVLVAVMVIMVNHSPN